MAMNATHLKQAIMAAIAAVPANQRATPSGIDQIWDGIAAAIVNEVQLGTVTVNVPGVQSGPSTAVGTGSVT